MAFKLFLSLFFFFAPDFSPFASSPEFNLNSTVGPSVISAEFSRLNGLQTGAPVVINGEMIGTVSSILQTQKRSKVVSLVSLKISPQHRTLMRSGTVAIVSSPLSLSRVQSEIVVKLVLPQGANAPALSDGERIDGYSSYREYARIETSHIVK